MVEIINMIWPINEQKITTNISNNYWLFKRPFFLYYFLTKEIDFKFFLYRYIEPSDIFFC